MITFIPKKGESNAHAGIRAGAKALLVLLAVPAFLWSKRADIVEFVRNLLRRS